MDGNPDTRLQEMVAWLSQFDGFADAVPEPASEDASFRRYLRVMQGDVSRIVMDAPPAQENCAPFIQVAGYLEKMSLNAPRVIAADLEKGFLLLTDLGSTQYLGELRKNPASSSRLYADALDALVTMQRRGTEFQRELPSYDETLLRFELSLFHDWLCGRHLGIALSSSEERSWQECCDWLVDNALLQEKVFVHRDYHSRNLMLTDEDNPGILDFQDAVEGPLTYDLVSLLKDCYISWPAKQVREWALEFHRRLGTGKQRRSDEDAFLRQFELMGVQRQLKAAGIFARLMHRDGKAGYLPDVPRTLNYILGIAPRYPQLAFLEGLIGERVLPGIEAHTA